MNSSDWFDILVTISSVILIVTGLLVSITLLDKNNTTKGKKYGNRPT